MTEPPIIELPDEFIKAIRDAIEDQNASKETMSETAAEECASFIVQTVYHFIDTDSMINEHGLQFLVEHIANDLYEDLMLPGVVARLNNSYVNLAKCISNNITTDLFKLGFKERRMPIYVIVCAVMYNILSYDTCYYEECDDEGVDNGYEL